jgi:hypothetical protein
MWGVKQITEHHTTGHTVVTENNGIELYLLTWKTAHSILSSEKISYWEASVLLL